MRRQDAHASYGTNDDKNDHQSPALSHINSICLVLSSIIATIWDVHIIRAKGNITVRSRRNGQLQSGVPRNFPLALLHAADLPGMLINEVHRRRWTGAGVPPLQYPPVLPTTPSDLYPRQEGLRRRAAAPICMKGTHAGDPPRFTTASDILCLFG